jgi:hypothetical protein
VTQAVAAYRADIEIGVRGVRYLDELQNKLTQVSKTIEQVNKQQVVIRRTIAGAASATPMGPGGSGVTSASAQAAAFAVEKRVSELRRADAQAQLKSLKDRSFAENYISGIISRRLQTKQQELAAEQKITAEKQKQAAATLRSRVGSAASNAVIGGAFPLLFGQGAGAAVGGGLGGAVGGAFGGTLGFGLSLVGTAIGQAVDDAVKLNQELNSLNNSLSSTGGTSRTTASDISQLASQLGIAKDEALKLVAAFSEFGSANIREALATSFGAVGGEEAFNALAAARDNKSTLEAIVKLRDTITDSQAKEALKQLEINGSAAANAFLQQRLITLQEQKLIKVAQEITLMDRLLAAAAALGAQGQFIDPAMFGKDRANEVRKGAAERKKAQDQALQDTRKFLSDVARLNEQFSTKNTKSPKPPEDRTAALQDDLQALIEMGNAEDLIRDLRFQGRDLLIPEVELTKKLSDIARDKAQALRQANYETERAAINQFAQARVSIAQKETEDQIRDIQQRRFEEELRLQDAVRNSVKVFTDLRQEQTLQVQYGKTYLRLVTEGLLPAEAARRANFEKLVAQELLAVEEQIKLTELAIMEAKARGASTVELDKQLKTFKEQQKAITAQAATGPGQGPTQTQRLESAVATARGQLNELTDFTNQVVAGAQAIGDAFSQAFRGLVTGAMTGQQALAAFFKGVGDHFMDMASKMIAKLIEIYILETVLGFISGAAAGSFTSKSNAAGKATFGGSFKGTGASTFGSGGIRVPGYAEGGFVTGPTRAVVGEGGEAEYIIPASKMRGAMARYSAGARGSAVIPGNGTSGGGGAAGSGSGAIDVRYTVERINSVDYVTADQFQRGMRQAALQGAEQGERRALGRLRNSPATRNRVGV